MPDALSRLPPSDTPCADIDDSFPDDSSTRATYRGPKGPVLDGVSLSELGADEVNKPTGKKLRRLRRAHVLPQAGTQTLRPP